MSRLPPRAARAVLLRNVATVATGTAVGQYERYNMARVVSITANIHGADLGSVARQIARAIADVGAPPPKTNVAVRGQIVPLQEMLDGFKTGLVVAVVVIFLLLAANFQSLRLSLVVVSTVPAVIAGVVLTLWLTGTTLNIQSAMGAIMAIGVAVANAILLVTFRRERTPPSAAAATPPARRAVEGRRAEPLAADPDDQLRDDRRHGADGPGPGRRRRPDRAAGPRGHWRAGRGNAGDLVRAARCFAIFVGHATTRSPSLDPEDEASIHFNQPAAS